MALLSRNVGKYEFLTGKDVLTEKNSLEKPDAIKKDWIFTIRYWVEKANWYYGIIISRIRTGF